MEKKPKTLGKYISSGRHEFVAFIRNMMSLTARDNYHTFGNDLGQITMGVLVCDKSSFSDEPSRAKFYHKESPIYSGDSDITFHDFNYDDAKVVSEIPLSLEIHSFYSGRSIKKKSVEYWRARKLMKKHGIF